MRAKAWFERWFGEEYKRLYPHRDASQAAAQVDALLRAIRGLDASGPIAAGLSADDSILDVGCGAGRHLRAFRNALPRKGRAFGIDLSPVLLRDARGHGLSVARADMRRLPFPDRLFALVACFFTSFGYFETPEEDAAALRELARVTRPGGLVFLDLPNRPAVLRGLVAAETTESAGRRVEVTRALEGNRVIKRIRIRDESGEECHEERVRLYSLASLGPVLDQSELETAAVLGDERGAPFDPEISPRMSLLLRRAA